MIEKRRLYTILVLLILSTSVLAKPPPWGFYAHKLINRQAVFRLPMSLYPFFRSRIYQITQNAVIPDQRRYIRPDEGAMHFIDLDEYDTLILSRWRANSFFLDSIPSELWMEHGALPGRLMQASYTLTYAFMDRDEKRITRAAAELGHYLADAHVPLHTTSNYDGQLTGQRGIHALWESQLPERFVTLYDLGGRRARYIDDLPGFFWKIILASNNAVDSVLFLELEAEEEISGHVKGYQWRNTSAILQFSDRMVQRYHSSLKGMVERRLRASIIHLADVWYTCWINAGQPELTMLDTDDNSPVLDSIRVDKPPR